MTHYRLKTAINKFKKKARELVLKQVKQPHDRNLFHTIYCVELKNQENKQELKSLINIKGKNTERESEGSVNMEVHNIKKGKYEYSSLTATLEYILLKNFIDDNG